MKKYLEITDSMINICLISLLMALFNYDLSSSKTLENHLRDYIHLSLLVALETRQDFSSLDFSLAFPSIGINLDQQNLKNYALKIKTIINIQETKREEMPIKIKKIKK